MKRKIFEKKLDATPRRGNEKLKWWKIDFHIC